MSLVISLFALAAAVGQPPEVPAAAVQVIQENGVFVMRTMAGGFPLYSYDRDAPNKSNCTGGCANVWPPLWAPADAKPLGKWTIVSRADGRKQWAYEGKPLYTNFADRPAVATGDGTDGIWHLLPTMPS